MRNAKSKRIKYGGAFSKKIDHVFVNGFQFLTLIVNIKQGYSF